MRAFAGVSSILCLPRLVGSLPLLRRLSSVSEAPTTGLARHEGQRVGEEQLMSQAETNRAAIAKIVAQFQHQVGDTGSTPVQVAVLTFKIKHLTEHMRSNRKDYSCQRSLVKMVHQRRRLLQYLEQTDHTAYQALLSQLQLRTPRPQPYSRPKP